MQAKHVIIFALIGMMALLGFNLINGNRHEKNRMATVSSSSANDGANIDDSDNARVNVESPAKSKDIAAKPLGQQPKAILDDVNAKIAQSQDEEQAKLTQMNQAQ